MQTVVRRESGAMFLGILLGLCMHALQYLFMQAVPGVLVYIGVTQWLYLAPVSLLAWRRRQLPLMRGLFTAGLLTALLNAAIYGVVYYIYFVAH